MTTKGIDIVIAKEVKTVNKPWGYEKWMANPTTDGDSSLPYAFKIIQINAPHKTSLQFHKVKRESNHLVKGTGLFHYHPNPMDIEKYIKGGYSQKELTEILNGIVTTPISPGSVIHIKPGYIHRIEATTEDLTFHEVSTTELEDVYRLSDDSGRKSGKIESEHQ